MIKLTKTPPTQEIIELLNKEKAKHSGTYTHTIIIDAIKKDFKNKCYLCEQHELTSINIEHFIPHRGDKELKFDYYNLFFSCPHCNNLKSDKYDNLLNVLTDDVENLISYHIKHLTKSSSVDIKAIGDSDKINLTVELLDKIYNGSTDLKIAESTNLKNLLVKELEMFTRHLRILEDDFADEDDKLYAKKELNKMLRPEAAFTAFKRQIIKDIPYFKEQFSQYF